MSTPSKIESQTPILHSDAMSTDSNSSVTCGSLHFKSKVGIYVLQMVVLLVIVAICAWRINVDKECDTTAYTAILSACAGVIIPSLNAKVDIIGILEGLFKKK